MLGLIVIWSILVTQATADTGEFSIFCTPQAIVSGKVFIPYPNDYKKFVLCTSVGHFVIANCDVGQRFSVQKLHCVSDRIVVTTPSTVLCPTPSWIDPTFSGISLPSGFTGECSISPGALCGYWYRRFDANSEMFIQCSRTGTHMLRKCLLGLTWNDQLKLCNTKTIEPVKCPVPSWVNPTEVGLHLDVSNPCPSGSRCNVYVGYPYNLNKFIECNKYGNGVIKSCPPGWNWSSTSQACGDVSGRTNAPVDNMPKCGPNPCRKSKESVLSQSEMYHDCPGSNKHFIMCDSWGNNFVKKCRDNLDWSEEAFTCGPAHVIGK